MEAFFLLNSSMEKFDICVIGGGPAGYAAAMRALDFGKRVCLVEMNRVGGAGLYDGALSSKTLWELSKDVSHARRRTEMYSKNQEFHLDYSNILEQLDGAILERSSQLTGHLDALQSEGYRDLFFYKQGLGKLLSKNEVLIQKKDAEDETIFANHIILATGSKPRKLPHIPIDEKTIVTSDGIHHWKELPESMVVLGAGVIGCEYATIFSNFGQTKVNIIDKADRILPFEDDDVAMLVQDNFYKNGVTVHHQTALVRMEIVDGEVEYELSCNNGPNQIHRVEKALVAVGRIPNSEGLGLEELGVKITDRGAVDDEDTRSSVPNIYAIGDLTADVALVNVGELEGRHAVKKILGHKNTLSYDNISSIMFLNPLVAAVGMNEKQAREKGLAYQVVSLDYACIPRAIAMRSPQGFFKIMVTNDREMKILGMRAVGPQASSAIQAVALLMSMEKGVEELAELIHPHPSLIEGIQECCRMLLGKSIFKPHVFRDHMKYRGYMDGIYEDLTEVSEIN